MNNSCKYIFECPCDINTNTPTTPTTPTTTHSMGGGNINLPSAAESKHVPTVEKTTEGAELDLVFAFDCTGSMGSYLSQAQANIKEIAKQIIASEHASVRMALVAYRDNPPQESTFATEVHGFTASHDAMASALMNYTAQGGGDGPECVADALHEVSRLAYRPNSAKVCVFIADAPPHGLGESGDGFPNGSPNGHDPYAISHKLAGLGVTMYCVGCKCTDRCVGRPQKGDRRRRFLDMGTLLRTQNYCSRLPRGFSSATNQNINSNYS
jgi:hypothetical protein